MNWQEQNQVKEVLKMASGEELAAVSLEATHRSDLSPSDRAEMLSLVNSEVAIRRNEPLLRKGSRFMSKHGEKMLAVGLGLVLGVEIGD